MDGIRTLTELVAPYKPLDFFCVWEPLYEQVKGAVSALLSPPPVSHLSLEQDAGRRLVLSSKNFLFKVCKMQDYN